MNDIEHHISIGELAELTEISTHTLRIWEKRYGFPQAERLPSGHRRYPRREVPRLRAVNRALEAGFRISKIVDKSVEDLEKLLQLDSGPAAASGEEAAGLPPRQGVLIEKWINHLHLYNDQKLTQSFYEEWYQRGPLHFILECGLPFVHEIGNRWYQSEIDVAQEHFGCERLYDFLGSMWRRMNERNTGVPMVLSTLPGETHRMGLQMCAVLVAWSGRRAIYLGPDTPVEHMAAALEKSGARVLCLSVSAASDSERCLMDFNNLRKRLDPKISLLAGGAGMPAFVPGVTRFTTMREFYDYLTVSP